MALYRIISFNVDDGTPSGYEGVVRIKVTEENSDLLIGRAVEADYINAVRVDKLEDKVELLKSKKDGCSYTEEHELVRVEKIK